MCWAADLNDAPVCRIRLALPTRKRRGRGGGAESSTDQKGLQKGGVGEEGASAGPTEKAGPAKKAGAGGWEGSADSEREGYGSALPQDDPLEGGLPVRQCHPSRPTDPASCKGQSGMAREVQGWRGARGESAPAEPEEA